jgi:hypothetical protein
MPVKSLEAVDAYLEANLTALQLLAMSRPMLK